MNTDLTGRFPLSELPIIDGKINETQDQFDYYKAQNDGYKRSVRHLESSIETLKQEMEFIKKNTNLCKENFKKAEVENKLLKNQLDIIKELYPPESEKKDGEQVSPGEETTIKFLILI